jgi:hypothetical protein
MLTHAGSNPKVSFPVSNGLIVSSFILTRKSGTHDPAAGSMGYIEIAFCKISRGGSTGERARRRAATAVSLLIASGVKRVPLLVN